MDATPAPKQKWTLTSSAFEGLLSWLAKDPDRAGERYEEIRSLLIKGFQKHGCTNADDLADETINRVAKRLPEIVATYVGEPLPYFYAVAHNIHMEYLRKPKIAPLPQTDLVDESTPSPLEMLTDDEPEYTCLTRCLERLRPQERELILQYYHGERQVKIRTRKELAERLGKKVENLRLTAQRIRKHLKSCIIDCINRKVPVG
jgi:RNA polymerase sigma factor (sigma-70 family)